MLQTQVSDVRAELASLQQQLSADRQQHQLEQQSLCQQHAMVSHSALCTDQLLLLMQGVVLVMCDSASTCVKRVAGHVFQDVIAYNHNHVQHTMGYSHSILVLASLACSQYNAVCALMRHQ